MSYIDDVFERGGAFDECLETYELRPGQIELARAFDRAIEAGRPLMAEGPTGVGKSFSYLVPSIYHSAVTRKGRALVVTANIALQEQLVKKDLPFLQKVLPWKFTFGLAKGRNNYLCLHKRHELEKKLKFDGEGVPYAPAGFKAAESEELRGVWTWTVTTDSGDKSDCPRGTNHIWWRLSSTQDDCLGQGCPFAKACWANAARKRAVEADVVVMNYHLRFVGRGAVTPEHAIMVCDEAHEAANIARDFLGWTLTVNKVNRVAAWLRRENEKTLANRLRDVGARFFMDVAERMDKKPIMRLFDPGWIDAGELIACLDTTSKIATGKAEEHKVKIGECLAEGDKEGAKAASVLKAQADRASDSAGTLAVRFGDAEKLSPKNWVFWTTQDFAKKSYSFEARPVEVAETISKMFFPEATHSVLLISATMTSGGSFNYVRNEVGVPEEAGEVVAPSPFDLKEQGLLLVPKDMSPPPTYGDRQSELAYHNDICFYAEELIRMCGGRSLLLFASWRNLNVVHNYLQESDATRGVTLLKQGDKPRMKLVETFKKDEKSVLLGVKSFWTGVDVPGRALMGLFIDKIPFGSPNDPVNKAVEELLKRQGRNVFMEKAVPEATIALRQGVGRLIRTRSDIGVVMIADTRLLHTGWGSGIVRSLPEFRKVRSLERAQSFAEERINIGRVGT